MELTSSDNISVFDSLRRRMMMPDPWIFSGPLPASNRWNEMIDALRQHWPEYLMEAAELRLFLVSGCRFPVLLFPPASPLPRVVPDRMLRRLLIGLAMGSTAI